MRHDNAPFWLEALSLIVNSVGSFLKEIWMNMEVTLVKSISIFWKVVVHLCGRGLEDSSKEIWAHLLLGSALPFLPYFVFPLDHSHLSRKPQRKKIISVNLWNIFLWLICSTEINCNQCSMTPHKARQRDESEAWNRKITYINRCIYTRPFSHDLLD